MKRSQETLGAKTKEVVGKAVKAVVPQRIQEVLGMTPPRRDWSSSQLDLNPFKKRPLSRSQELRRYEEADTNLGDYLKNRGL